MKSWFVHYKKTAAAAALIVAVLLPMLLFAMPQTPESTAQLRMVRPFPTPPLPPPPPRLQVERAETPVYLQQLDVQVDVAGQLATTRYRMRFYNPNNRVLEGFLEFPLAQNQHISGFALDIDGQMREAVAVPKQQGRAVFEAIVRRGVDPGLLEQVAGQHYRVRVYPLPAKGTRQVEIEVSQPLRANADGQLQLPLPLEFARQADSVQVQVNGVRNLQLQGLARAPNVQRRGMRSRFELNAQQRQQTLALHWQQRADTEQTVLRQQHQGQQWALVSLPAPQAASGTPRQINQLGLLWDASLSRAEQDHSLALEAIQRLITDAQIEQVHLQLLRDKPEAVQVFDVRGNGFAALAEALRTVVYDGASNPRAWQPVAAVKDWLYVGDGLFNYGQPGLPRLAAGQRLDVLVDARYRHDMEQLQRWAERHQGRALLLDSVQSVNTAIDALRHDGVRIARIQTIGASDAVAASLWPGDDGRVQIAAKVQSADALLRVHWHGAGTTEVALQADVDDGAMAARQWAHWTIAQLQSDSAPATAQIQSISQRYGIVSAQTWLIVLETVEDYVRYDIPPPPSLQQAYAQLRSSQQKQRNGQRQQQLDRVARGWAERMQWWQRQWPKDTPPPPIPESRKQAMLPQMIPSMPPPAAAPRASSLESAPSTFAEAPASQSDAAVARSNEEASSAASNQNQMPAMRIQIQPWTSDTAPARQLRQGTAATRYQRYLDLRHQYRQSPAFYLDAAQLLAEQGEKELALRVLSNLAELEFEDRHLLRVLGYRLMHLQAAEYAVAVFEKVRSLAADEPQSHRDLGLALAMHGEYQAAADALYEVVQGQWSRNFGDISLIALAELNALRAAHPQAIDSRNYDARLLENLPLGLRVVLSWDADNTDIDLWVTDPNGEETYYQNKRSYQGGQMSADVTGGYGPEEFVLRNPKPGKYIVRAHYYGNQQQIVTGETSLMLWLSTGFGTPQQQDRYSNVRLSAVSEQVFVGEFEVR